MNRSGSIGEAALARTSAAASSRLSGEKFVTIRYGMPRSLERGDASTAPGSGSPLQDDDAVGVEEQAADAARAPSRRPRRSRGHPADGRLPGDGTRGGTGWDCSTARTR